MSLRILFALHGPGDPGTAVFANVHQRGKYLEELGHSVDFLSAEDVRPRGVSPRLDPLVLPLALLRFPLASYDVIVFHSYLGWAFHARRRRPSDRAATITMFHGLEPLYHRVVSEELARRGARLSMRFRLLHNGILPWLTRRSTRRSDAVFCLNAREASYLAEQGWAEPARIHVVSNGVADEFLTLARVERGGSRFLCIAQWLAAKGTRYLVEAFTAIARRRAEVTLVCAGTGAPAAVVLRDFPADLRHRVTVMPRLDRDGVRDALRSADMFVFPSLSEGSSLALLEALASGLPVVCTATGAAPELLTSGTNALIVPPADAVALEQAMQRLVDDAALRRALGRAAVDAARPLTWSRVAAEYHAHLLQAVESHGAH